MVDNPVWKVCERVAEVQALLDDHLAGGEHSAADVVAKVQAVLSEAELVRALGVFWAWRIIWPKTWSYPSLAAVRSVGSRTYRCLWTITTTPSSPAQSADMKLHGRSSFRSRLRINECHPRAASRRPGRSRNERSRSS